MSQSTFQRAAKLEPDPSSSSSYLFCIGSLPDGASRVGNNAACAEMVPARRIVRAPAIRRCSPSNSGRKGTEMLGRQDRPSVRPVNTPTNRTRVA